MKPLREDIFLKVDESLNLPITIGRYVYAMQMPNIRMYSGGCRLTIGNFVCFSPNVTIIVGGEHYTEWLSQYPFAQLFEDMPNRLCAKHKGDITIGSDVWIGTNATILSGVTIGHGAVIGASAVVTHDVKPYEVVAGNPAKHIRFRFTREEIEKLLALEWWTWSDEKIKTHVDVLMSDNVDILDHMLSIV